MAGRGRPAFCRVPAGGRCGTIEITGSFIIDDPVYQYGLQRIPSQHRYEEMGAQWWSSAFAAEGLVLLPEVSVAILQPIPLPSPTLKSQWTFPATGTGAADTSAKWREVVDPVSGLTVIEMPDAGVGQVAECVSAFQPEEDSGFYLDIYHSEAVVEAPRTADDIYVAVALGQGQVGSLKLTLAWGAPPILELLTTLDGETETWVEVARAADQMPDCAAYVAGQSDGCFRIRVLPLPCEGAILFSVGQGDATLVYRQDGAYLPAGPVWVAARNGVTRVQFRPMRFNPLGSALSSVVDHGNLIVNPPQAQADAAQGPTATVTVEVEVLYDTMSQYALTLDATGSVDDSGLATATPVVRSVYIFFPGVTYNGFVPHTRQMNMKRFAESLTFDLGTLSYSALADITCDNFAGQWSGASGIRAASFAAGIDGENWQRVTGLVTQISQSRNDPVRETTFRVMGREYWLKRKKVGVIGPLDGWDIYAAMRFLLQRGGVTDDWVDMPYTYPGRGAPSDYYHLPVGTGLTGALFQFDPRTSIWDCMCQLARKVRGFFGFDVFGFFRFYRWSPVNFGGYKQAFSTLPGFYDGVPLYNQLKNTTNTVVDLEDVRSDITLGSIDPFTWQPIFAHAHNESVVTDISDPSFLGNEDVYVEINNLLFDPDMQDQTMAALAYQASLPGLNVNLQGYYQHRLLPLDVVSVEEDYCVGGLVPFYVTRMNSAGGINERSHFGDTTLSGRWLLNG